MHEPIPPDDRPPNPKTYQFGHHEVTFSQHTVDGHTYTTWQLYRDGVRIMDRPFTSVGAMKEDLKACLAELRQERTQERDRTRDTPRREQEPAKFTNEFSHVFVGVWEDEYPPYEGQWVVTRGGPKANPEDHRITPYHRYKPRESTRAPKYVIAEHVHGDPNQAIIKGWGDSLDKVFEEAEVLEVEAWNRALGIGPRKPERAKEPEPERTPDPPREWWAVVRFDRSLSTGGAFVKVMEVFPDRDQAELYALQKGYAAVYPTPFHEEVKVGQTLLADGEPTEDFNGKKLNRIIEEARKAEEFHKQQEELADRLKESQDRQWDDRKAFGPEPRDIANGDSEARRAKEGNFARDRYAVYEERVRLDEARTYTVAVWQGRTPPEQYQNVWRTNGLDWDHTRGRGGELVETEPQALPLKKTGDEKPSGKPLYLLLKRTIQKGVYQVLNSTSNRALAYLKAELLEGRGPREGPRKGLEPPRDPGISPSR